MNKKYRLRQRFAWAILVLVTLIIMWFFDTATYGCEVDAINTTIFVTPKQVGIELEKEYDNGWEYHDFSEAYINFDPWDVTQPSYAHPCDIESILPDSMRGLGYSFWLTEQETDVNAVFLIGLTSLESAYNTSNFARERNNVSGFMAFDHSVNESTLYFKSVSQCIMTTGKALSRDYLSVDGRYYRGESTADINKFYASDPNWHWKIENIAWNLLDTK